MREASATVDSSWRTLTSVLGWLEGSAGVNSPFKEVRLDGGELAPRCGSWFPIETGDESFASGSSVRRLLSGRRLSHEESARGLFTDWDWDWDWLVDFQSSSPVGSLR